MKKVILLAVNSSWSHSSLSLYYMRAMLETLPYRTEIYNCTLKDDHSDILSELIAKNPDILCASVYIWNRAYLERLLSAVASLRPRIKIIIGGPEAPYLKAPHRYTLIKGPGELAFKRLAESGFQIHEDCIEAENYLLKEIPFPYREEDKRDLEGKLVYYETGRGCPYGCVYCLSAQDPRREFRFDTSNPRDLEKLHRELDSLIALKPKTLKFVDRSFNINKDLAHRIWEYMIDREDACICHFEIYPDLITDDDIRILKKVKPGRFRFEIGIQTCNPEALKASGRNTDWQKSKEQLLKLKEETHILMHCDLLIGLPGDSYQWVIDSLDQLMEIRPAELQLGLLKILPDTPMLSVARERGYIWEEIAPYKVLQSDTMSFEEIIHLDRLAHVINLYWNKADTRQIVLDALSKSRASDVFLGLVDYHINEHLPFHSLSPARRSGALESVISSQIEAGERLEG